MKNIVNKGYVTIDKNANYLYNFIVTKFNQIKLKQIYTYIFKARGELEWHNQKEDGQKQEHIQKDQHGKKKIQHQQTAHIVMNQYYHTEFVKTVVTMTEKKQLQKKKKKMHNQSKKEF